MALKVCVLCRPALAAGFELAGLQVTLADSSAHAVEEVNRLAADPTVGMVFVDSDLYRGLPRKLTTRFDRQALPVVAPFPAPAWDASREAEAYILEILHQAIGYRVRPR